MIDSIKNIGVSGLLDIVIMTLMIYTVLIWFKRTKAAFVLTGIFIIAGIYLLTRQFNLTMTAAVFERFFAVILIILVVVFQEELRHFFEDVAVWSLNKRHRSKKTVSLSRQEVETLVRTLLDFSRERIGALIVIRGKNLIARHVDGGVNLNGELSEPLLKSIFDPHSTGHDGAAVIDGNRVATFACHLPLSKTLAKIKDRGTRHAAALGLSEVSDALCLVVSEEKGTICLAQDGDIRVENDPEQLTARLQAFYDAVSPIQRPKPWEEFFKRNTREKVYSLLLSIGLWFVLVDGARVTYRSFSIPVSTVQLPEEWTVAATDPRVVKVTFRGPRTAFYFNVQHRIKLYLDMKIQAGPQRVEIHADDFVFPKGLILEDVSPDTVSVILSKLPKATGQGMNNKMMIDNAIAVQH